jgi:hypothetical protein
MSAEVGSQAVIRAQPVTSPLLLSPSNPPLTIPCRNNPPQQRTKLTKSTKKFLWFPCGIVRGALAALGITATVQAETSELPGAVFQIKTVSAKT